MSLVSSSLLTVGMADAGVFGYFEQSNFAGKVIVLALIAFSLIAWTLMIGKYLELKRLGGINQFFESKLEEAGGIIGFDVEAMVGPKGPFGLLVKGVNEAFFLSHGQQKVETRMGQIENALHRGVAKQSANYETKMVMLGSIVAGAPFLGLLGTVWGVMDAFGNIALQQSSSLQHLAPGVSGALLTTVAALLVAIPSVFGYNFLLSRVKQMVVDLENFASVLADRVELELNQ